MEQDRNLASRIERQFAGAGASAIAAAAGFVWFIEPAKASFLPACPLFSMTGFACPGCGMTRGLHALMHGDIVTALDHNALIPLVILFFGFIFVSLMSVVVRGRGLVLSRWNLALLWATLVVLIVFGVVRNLPYYPFTILFP